MSKLVSIDGVGSVEFPDDASQDEIVSWANDNFPPAGKSLAPYMRPFSGGAEPVYPTLPGMTPTPPPPDSFLNLSDEQQSAAPDEAQPMSQYLGPKPTADLLPNTIPNIPAKVAGAIQQLRQAGSPEPQVSNWSQLIPSMADRSPEEQDALARVKAGAEANPTGPGNVPGQKAEDIMHRYDALIEMTADAHPERIPMLQAERDRELENIGAQPIDVSPEVKLPRMTQADVENITDLKGRSAQVVANLQNAAAGAAEGFASPEGLSMLAPGTTGAVFGKAFLPGMAKSAAQKAAEALGAYSAGDTETGDKAAVDALTTAAMLAVPAHEALKGKAAEVPEPEAPETAPRAPEPTQPAPEPAATRASLEALVNELTSGKGLARPEVRPSPENAPTEEVEPAGAVSAPKVEEQTAPEGQPAQEPGEGEAWFVPWADGRGRAWFRTRESADEFYRQKLAEDDADGPPQVGKPETGVKYADANWTPLTREQQMEEQMRLANELGAEEPEMEQAGAFPAEDNPELAPVEPEQSILSPEEEMQMQQTLRETPEEGQAAKPNDVPLNDVPPGPASVEPATTPENPDTAELRESLGVSQEALDAYSPQDAVSKLGRKWYYKTLEGTDTGPFDTKRMAVDAATRHKDLKQAQFDNPAAYRDIASVRADKRLALMNQYQAEGMTEVAAGGKARAAIPGELTPEGLQQDRGIAASARRKLASGEQGEAGFIHLPTREDFLNGIADLPEHVKRIFAYATDLPRTAKDWLDRGVNRDLVSADKDASTSRANISGARSAALVRHELNRALGIKPSRVPYERNELAEMALTAVVESGGDRNALAEFKQTLQESGAPQVSENEAIISPIWKRRYLKALDFADQNWDKLKPVADLYKGVTDAENAWENQNGVPTLYRQGGYVFHLQDMDAAYGRPSGNTSEVEGSPQPFRKNRDYPTYADSIAAGLDPKSLNAIDLLQKRITLGQSVVNFGKFIDNLHEINDPVTQEPLSVQPEMKRRQDGTEYLQAPPGYSLANFGGRDIALHNGYAGLMARLTHVSDVTKTAAGESFMQLVSGAKHATLLLDTYHLGRLAFWNAVSRTGMPSFRRGQTLLDNTLPEVQRMVDRGEIPKEYGRQIIEDKQRLDQYVKAGLNVGQIADNLYTDLVQKVPVIGPFNKWLFGQYQRGAMSEVALIEGRRIRSQHPEWSDHVVARQVARDVNTRFGNLGSQGWMKSKTFQDLARIIFLAPQWNESLIRSELGAMKQAGAAGFNLAQGRSPKLGMLARGVGTALLAQFAANQLINYATRGRPTWENEEGADQGKMGWLGAKISAYIPDAGGGPGFFLNPMSLPMEISHLLAKSAERHGGDWTQALNDYLGGRLSGVGRFIDTMRTGRDQMGRSAGSGLQRVEMAAKNLLPAPISGSSIYNFGKQLITGQHEEQQPGQFERQLFQSGGVKLENAPSSDQRMRALAVDFNRQHNVKEDAGAWSETPALALIQAVRRQNTRDEAEALQSMLSTTKSNGQPTTPADVIGYFRRWANAPFTRSAKRERDFVSSLNPEQQQTYEKARSDRAAVRDTVFNMIQALPEQQPQTQ